MLSSIGAFILASVAALVVGVIAGLVGMAAMSPGLLGNLWHWSDAKPLMLLASYNFMLGLLPGLLAHSLMARLRLTGLIPYLASASLIGSFWCIVIRLSAVGWAYVLPSALFGTATFWALRRPDRTG